VSGLALPYLPVGTAKNPAVFNRTSSSQKRKQKIGGSDTGLWEDRGGTWALQKAHSPEGLLDGHPWVAIALNPLW